MNIIPSPQEIIFESKENVNLSEFPQKIISGISVDALEIMKKDFPGNWKLEDGNGFYFHMMKDGSNKESDLEVPEKPDAYALQITKKGVFINAKSEAGLLCGLQSLSQMLTEKNTVQVCEICDYATIPFRGIHWDLKGYLPKFSVLLDEFRRLANYKINLVLLELEDKYAFKCAPGIGVEGAYTFDQLRTLSRYASVLGIRIVPKLQCLGHVDYILKHSRYKHLREGKHPYQFCPRSNEAFGLWQSMASELMECFSEHDEFFHIGADETDKLGVCQECSKYTKGESYIFHVGRCLDFIVEQGRSPVMWDDIIRDAHGVLGEAEAATARKLASKAILNYWAYGYNGKKNIFPAIPTYKKYKAEIWAASGFSGCERWDGCIPPLEVRSKNIDAWTKTAMENKIDTVISTGWTRIASATPPTEPHETSWFTILYAANSMWSGKERDCEEFIDALSSNLYKERLPENLRKAILNIIKNPFSEVDIDEDSAEEKPHLALLQYLAATESFSCRLDGLVAHRRMFQGKIGDTTTDYVIEGRRKMIKLFLEKLTELEDKTKKYLSKFYEPTTVNEFLTTRFEYSREFAEDFLDCLDKTDMV